MEVYSWENHLFLWVIYTMAMLNNQMLPSGKHGDLLSKRIATNMGIWPEPPSHVSPWVLKSAVPVRASVRRYFFRGSILWRKYWIRIWEDWIRILWTESWNPKPSTWTEDWNPNNKICGCWLRILDPKQQSQIVMITKHDCRWLKTPNSGWL